MTNKQNQQSIHHLRLVDQSEDQHALPLAGRKIRFALVGCGRIAENHFRALAQHDRDAELVGVCDTNADALAAANQDLRSTEALVDVAESLLLPFYLES